MSSPVVAGKYQLLRRLGKGGMAEVFLAKQTGLKGFEKLIVLKRILPDRAMDGEFVTMFLDEARTAADLRHPNVINVFDINRAEGTYYMAMEFLHGHDVRQLLKQANEKREWVPIGQSLEIVLGVAAGLFHAHTKTSIEGMPLHIVHRDVSPPNILVGFNGEVKIVDFGIAKAETQSQETEIGAVKGKYAYMSPEQARGQTIDHRSDQFALGIVMWELLTQRRLFKRENGPKTMMAIVDDKPPRVRDVRPDVPKAVDKVVMKMLEKSPAKRYDSCEAMRLDLEEVLAAEGVAHSAARLARFMKELFDGAEPEAALSEERLDEGDLADLSEQYREELQKASGRAPPKRARPPARERTDSRSSTRREVPNKKAGLDSENTAETVANKSARSSEARSDTGKSVSKATGSKTRPTQMAKKLPGDADPDDQTLILPDGGLSELPRPAPRQGAGTDRRTLLLVAAGAGGALLLVGAGVGIGLAVSGPGNGSVIVRSSPKGAHVFVDGKDTGEVTPHLLKPKVGSAVKIRLEKKGYRSESRIVEVRSEKAVEIEVDLEEE